VTSRERIECAFSCGTPDRVPVSPFTLGHLSLDDEFTWEFIRAVDPIMDVGVGGGDPFLGKNIAVDATTDGNRTIYTYHFPGRDLCSVLQRTDITQATVEFMCKTADDVEVLLGAPYEPPEPDPTYFLEFREKVGDEGLVLGGSGTALCWAAGAFSPEDFCLLWADAPDAMIEMTRVANERLCEWYEKACRKGVDGFRLCGGEYASTQLGPAAFEALCQGPDRQVTKIMREHGAWVYYHNHGPIMRYLDMMADMGLHALDPLEAIPWGDCRMPEAREKLRGKVCIVGNLDDMEVVEKRGVDEVKAMGRRLIEEAGPDGFCLGGTASGTYTEKGARNFMALVEVAKEKATT
jgi:hypothetical protein